VIAAQAQKSIPESHPDWVFYEGKKQAALWFSRNVLPGVENAACVSALEDASAMEIPDAAFVGP
jgi:hypothetical protein